MNHTFLASWDIYGLEFLLDVTLHEQENMIALLKEEKLRHRNPIQHLMLRAQFNPQRHYEIYSFQSEMDENTIREVFKITPQVIVDKIRQTGNKIYSNRENIEDRIIN